MRSFSLPGNVHLSHKKANPSFGLQKIEMSAPIMGLSIRQWSHDSPSCKCGFELHHFCGLRISHYFLFSVFGFDKYLTFAVVLYIYAEVEKPYVDT